MYRSTRSISFFRLFIDYAIITLSLLLTKFILVGKAEFISQKALLVLMLFSYSAWFFVGKMADLHAEVRTRAFADELISLIKTLILYSLLLTCVFFFFFKDYNSPRSFLVFHCALISFVLPIEKYLFRLFFAKLRAEGKNHKKVLIVGAGEVGMKFYKSVVENDFFGYKLAGFVDDKKQPHLNGEYLGSIADLNRIFQNKDVQDVIVALPNSAREKIEEIVTVSERNAKRVKIIPDYHRFGSGNFKVTNYGSFPVVAVRSLPLDDFENRFFKRFFDVIFSLLLFICVFSWLFPLIVLAIRFTSKGSAFFKQERWGIDNKKIICYKFRSMVTGCDGVDLNGRYIQATKSDKRVTAVGRFLRKTNLDELPQFFNVLKGDMSVVGPRPHPIPLNLESKDIIHNYMLRHLVKPGITGWAQVCGLRGETKGTHLMQKRIDLDIWYIENWSFGQDCQIIIQTVINMIKGEDNAY
jgi:putative colanic acid biosynthesis UDP-glucose lipid carrier transferase